ncbi:MAG: DUF1255 family protein [Candidatus Kerfeldbacteria bacterium]|nr:DUF1255 family protein [Candidatus Kerfeldbacteria bacterium]
MNNKIEYHVYFDGIVQSLEFKTPDGKKVTLGVIMPGDYNFGPATEKETIFILLGTLSRIGIQPKTFYPDGELLVFEPGMEIKISCAEPVAYLCLYG